MAIVFAAGSIAQEAVHSWELDRAARFMLNQRPINVPLVKVENDLYTATFEACCLELCGISLKGLKHQRTVDCAGAL